jgi:Fe-S-cluster-containing dehydrogenase component
MKKLLIDLDVCIGCTAHAAACNRVNHDTVTFRTAEVDKAVTLPAVCRHCEDPACVKACPREAMRKEEDGTVRRSSNLCSGCRSCVLACPFGVLGDAELLGRFNMSKCDLCHSRVAEGRLPACVATCPTGAIKFEEMPDAVQDTKDLLIGGHVVARNPYRRRSS